MATKTATQPSVHHMVRTISTSGVPGPSGELPVEQVDADVAHWVDQGYELKSAHYAGDTPGGIRILYVFAKNGAG